jgi:hypothetical protein
MDARYVDVPASTLDESGGLPIVHDLLVLGAAHGGTSLALVVTVGTTTSLVCLLVP